jgi:hypothetical protein
MTVINGAPFSMPDWTRRLLARLRPYVRVARWYIVNPKIPIWVNFGMEKVGLFSGRLAYIIAILYILWPFGNLVAIWYIFPRFGILCHEKSGIPALRTFSSPSKKSSVMRNVHLGKLGHYLFFPLCALYVLFSWCSKAAIINVTAC